MITDKDIAKAFEDTEFGDVNKSDMIIDGLLRVACGYKPGRTLCEILYELDLTTSSGVYCLPILSNLGKRYLFEWFDLLQKKTK